MPNREPRPEDHRSEAVGDDFLQRLWALTPEREYIETLSGGYFAWAAGVRAAVYDQEHVASPGVSITCSTCGGSVDPRMPHLCIPASPEVSG